MKDMKYLLLSGLILISSVGHSMANYHPEEGRWISRDPIEEEGGLHLYAFIQNHAVNDTDSLGMMASKRPPAPPAAPRWVARPYTRPDAITIVCDGKGGIRVQIPEGTYTNAIEKKCLEPCTKKHEECHKAHALAANPNVCKDQPEGVQVGAATESILYVSELVCHAKALTCLKNIQEKDAECKCERADKYEKHIQDELERYRKLLEELQQKEKQK